MLDEFVKKASQIFSSKRNAGKLVRSLTDRFHYYKLILLTLCMVILIGYSQFRDHFECSFPDRVDKKRMTNFCWLNGTTTLDLMDAPGNGSTKRGRIGHFPHIGMSFQFKDDRYELISHNYMRSLWLLLILMAICSYFAQVRWASIFKDDTMRALLALPGHDKLTLVKKAQEAKAYEMLMKIPAIKSRPSMRKRYLDTLTGLFESGQLFTSIDLLTSDENDHNHLLDYYPNQLIYLLMAARTSAYKLCDLRLKRKLILHSICSFSFTMMQFVLPWLFIGDKYTLYGFYYFRAWLNYAKNQLIASFASNRLRHKQQVPINSVDYELSSRIWPILTQCEYKKYGYLNVETITVHCTVSINEICAKLFVVIWWFVAINIVIEILSLLSILISSTNIHALKWTFGKRFWPRAREEAKIIATFRYKIATHFETNLASLSDSQERPAPVKHNELSECEKKQLEVEQNGITKIARDKKQMDSNSSLCSKRWYLWCFRDIGLFLAKSWRAKKSVKDEEGYKEVNDDPDIYYLLYLLYLRLERSEKKIERVIRMTGGALKRYLDSLNRPSDLEATLEDSFKKASAINSNGSSATDESETTTIIDVMTREDTRGLFDA